MATLKDDDSSWKAHGLKKKIRDWENDPKPRVIVNKKKDTRKWCKGKPGQKHDVQTVLVVTLTDKCARNGQTVDGKRVYCGHWRHYEDKCINCGKSSYRIPESKPDNIKQKELETKWCREGHLYDWIQRSSEFMWRRNYEIQTCVMCGKTKGKSRRKIDG